MSQRRRNVRTLLAVVALQDILEFRRVQRVCADSSAVSTVLGAFCAHSPAVPFAAAMP
jgi:hypothetical protein